MRGLPSRLSRGAAEKINKKKSEKKKKKKTRDSTLFGHRLVSSIPSPLLSCTATLSSLALISNAALDRAATQERRGTPQGKERIRERREKLEPRLPIDSFNPAPQTTHLLAFLFLLHSSRATTGPPRPSSRTEAPRASGSRTKMPLLAGARRSSSGSSKGVGQGRGRGGGFSSSPPPLP